MKPLDRYKWIIRYMKDNGDADGERFDVLRKSFVDAYVEATGAKVIQALIGVDKCRQLGKDLSQMHRAGYLFQNRLGISDNFASDFGLPKWVYQYWVHREIR